MSNWPTVPFYILSQLNLSNLVVVLNSDNHAVLAPLAGTADQLWVATPDVRGGARLTNLLSGLALYGRTGDPSWVGAGAVDLSVSGGGWVLDDFPSDGWHRIECLPASNNWWMQVDVPWTATATFQSCVPNVKPYAFQMTGTFTGLNATSSEVTVADVTSGRPGANGQGAAATSVPVPLSGSAATVPTL